MDLVTSTVKAMDELNVIPVKLDVRISVVTILQI